MHRAGCEFIVLVCLLPELSRYCAAATTAAAAERFTHDHLVGTAAFYFDLSRQKRVRNNLAGTATRASSCRSPLLTIIRQKLQWLQGAQREASENGHQRHLAKAEKACLIAIACLKMAIHSWDSIQAAGCDVN